ncbi:MAG: N-6 DNA methylase [Deltaproteobacteria bacterium]
MTNIRSTEEQRAEEEVLELTSQVLTEIIHHVASSGTYGVSARCTVFQNALSSFVDGLLSRHHFSTTSLPHDTRDLIEQHIEQKIGTLSLKQIGRVYEYLRGFELDLQSGTDPKLVPSVRTKRNLGLFYTPPQIVSHIVETSLDALRIREAGSYLDVRILDPAVGTGAFLVETLDRLTLRVLSGTDTRTRQRVEQLRTHYRNSGLGKALGMELDEERAVRISLLENCLYGIDLDPIAVDIARAAILKKAFGQLDFAFEVKPHVRVGNALMGMATSKAGPVHRMGEDCEHARAYFGTTALDRWQIHEWTASNRVFHWPLEFPEVFSNGRRGFDVVLGNPPYEIVSVKESGIQEKSREQVYFRRTYRTCHGKINTYRLMMERGLTLLREGGALGFIVPATLLGDSTAAKLRDVVLNESRVLEAVVIPEKARVFKGVTQALLILVMEKGGKTDTIRPIFWDGIGPIPPRGKVGISRELWCRTSDRVPLLRSPDEKRLLEKLTRHPPLKGNGDVALAARVHQGLINISVYRNFLTSEPTYFPLVRGEHVAPFHLRHPSPRGRRLDWVLPAFLRKDEKPNGRGERKDDTPARLRRHAGGRRGCWEQRRIVLGRAVNMETDRRLKAAAAPPGTFLGDMTNFISDASVPFNYLLGLLNSRLFDWRIKVTSTNNYVSAGEIEGLPIPRIPKAPIPQKVICKAQDRLCLFLEDPGSSVPECCEEMRAALESEIRLCGEALLPMMIEQVSEAIQVASPKEGNDRWTDLLNLLDALVLLLYGVESSSAPLWER